MARPGVTESDVFQAIEQLQQAGKEITPNNIRTHLGTGSYSTISAAISKWRAVQDLSKNVPEMPEPVKLLVQKTWAETWKAADASFEAARTAFETEKASLTRQLQEMGSEIQRLENVAADHQAAREASRQELSQLCEKRESLQMEVQRLTGRIESLSEELQKARSDAEAARKELAPWMERAMKAEAAVAAKKTQKNRTSGEM